MAICIYTYIYVTSSRLIGWKFCSKLQFNVSFSTHGYTFHPFFRARRKYSLQPSIIFKILLLHGTVCTVYLQHVSYFACSRYLYTSKKKKKSLPFWRKLIALLFFYHALLTYVFVSLYVSFHFFFFYTNIACIEEFYKTLLYIYNLWSIAIRSNILDNRSVD